MMRNKNATTKGKRWGIMGAQRTGDVRVLGNGALRHVGAHIVRPGVLPPQNHIAGGDIPVAIFGGGMVFGGVFSGDQ